MLTARFNGSCCSPVSGRVSPRNSMLLPVPNIDAFFESMFGGSVAGPTVRGFPALNIFEDANNILVEAELPGFSIEDLDISLTDNHLSISGERKTTFPKESEVLRSERPSGKFTRVLRLPVEVDAQKVAATLKDGILSVTLPKPEVVKPRKISVTVA